MEEPLPIEANHREDGAKLNDKGERMHEGIALRHSHEVLCDAHVAGGGHRKKFCEPFNDGYDHG